MPEESAWGVLQKLAWLNVCHPAEALHVLLDRKVGLPTLRDNPRSLLDSAWLRRHLEPSAEHAPGKEDFRGHEALRCRLYTATGSGAFGKLASHLLAADLRACDLCLAEGLHLQLHQVAGIRCCPIHGGPVTYRCSQCGESRGGFTNAGQVGGFRCMRCGECWLSQDRLKPARKLHLLAIERSVTPLMAWLRRVWEELQQTSAVRCLEMVPYETPTLKPLFLPEAAFGLCLKVRPYADASVVSPLRISGVTCLTVTATGRPAMTEAALSRHELIRGCRAAMEAEMGTTLSKHSECMTMIEYVMRTINNNGTRLSLINPRACILVQAHLVWWERVEMFFKRYEDGSMTQLWATLVPICLRSSFHAAILEVLAVHRSALRGNYDEMSLDLSPDSWLQWLGESVHDQNLSRTRVLRLDLGRRLKKLYCDGGATARERFAYLQEMMERSLPTGPGDLASAEHRMGSLAKTANDHQCIKVCRSNRPLAQ